MRVVGRRRGAASGVGTRRESVPGGSVAASMPPHGPAPGRDTTLPALPLLIGKQCVKHVLISADSVAAVIGKRSIWRHAPGMDARKNVQLIWLFALLSGTDRTGGTCACRHGTLSGIDAAQPCRPGSTTSYTAHADPGQGAAEVAGVCQCNTVVWGPPGCSCRPCRSGPGSPSASRSGAAKRAT
ncbi:hypothetical protein XarbCFBP8130_16490 [Xanthomonas arboricola]|nr:hypothetical protein XarCFBP6771_08975 [Xanthomonas arboricola]PPT55837.1 hypothetical protein XarbCFBP8153_18905 [Xanthomonas arboricola]PPT62249.1 hypothetical protein XarbCFBP8130_16490 [Xanthomonas arboricola]PPT68538.1 hypothetical protein XarbCFBP8150_14700 [Xanthomonas arboricola]